MTRLLTLILPVWPTMLAAVCFSILTILCNVGLMGVSAFLIASAALHPSVAALSTAIVGVRFFGIARAVCRYVERFLSHDATFRLLSRLRVLFYQAIEPLAPARLSTYRSGDLLSRMAGDVDSLQFFYLRVLSPPVVALVTLGGMAYWLSLYSGKFTTVLLGGFLAAGVVLPLVVKWSVSDVADQASEARGYLNSQAVDAVQGLAELAVFGQTEQQAEKIMQANARLNALQTHSAQATALADAWGSFIVNFTIWLFLILAVPMVRNGQVSGVDLAVLVLVLESSFEAVLPLAMLYPNLRDSREAYQRLYSVIDTKTPVADLGEELPSSAFDIEFRDVSFSYNDGTGKVFDKASFKVKSGQRVAIVGESGAGKSSIISLLLRFWDCQTGSIKLGGRDIKNYRQDHLRELFSVVPQFSYIFNASLKDNVLLAKPDASTEEFSRSIELAALKPVIESLPEGGETLVGENGRSLSGGQRQRIAIARALLKNAPVLVLDEPTVGLDPVTELDVMDDIKRAMAGRTTILVTHRLVGLEAMDEIIVLEKGRVVEHGTQAGLLARRGLFATMWQQQKNRLS